MTDKFTHPDDAPDGHKWQTRSGMPARIICSDQKTRKGYFILSLIERPDGYEVTSSHGIDGAYIKGEEHDYDLIDAPRTHTVWVNAYEGGLSFHDSLDEANRLATDARTACAKFTYKDGEGL